MATAKYRVRWRWDTLGQSSLQAVLTNPVLSALAHFNTYCLVLYRRIPRFPSLPLSGDRARHH